MRCIILITGVALAVISTLVYADESDTADKRFLIVDTHIDTPYRNWRNELNIFDGTNSGEFDLPRAQQGGLSVAFMSIYTPASAADDGTSRSIALELIDWVETTASSSGDVAVATCTADVRTLHATGVLALAMGMENASPLEGDASNLHEFYDRGVRYVTLAHSKSNEFSDSSYDENEPLQGLSEAGRELVALMNQFGVMIDISHLSDKAAWEVLNLSTNPVIASHSSLRHFIPDFHRNISDDMVAAMKKNNGVVQINFGSSFISAEARQWQSDRNTTMLEVNANAEITSEERSEIYADYTVQHPFPYATVDTVADHIDRVVELAGIDHVGLGSDFDGVGDTLPEGLKDVSMFPNLIKKLIERDYDTNALRKVLGENLMRVWDANEAIATDHGHPPICAQP